MEIPCPNRVSFDAPSHLLEAISRQARYRHCGYSHCNLHCNLFLSGHYRDPETNPSSFFFHIEPPIDPQDFLFQLRPPTDMPPPASTVPPPTVPQPATDPQVSLLRLSPEELKICEKWITPYSALETTEDRLKMLRGAILPRLAKVNTGMPEEVWKPRKSVSVVHPAVE